MLDKYFIHKNNESTGILNKIMKPEVIEDHLIVSMCNSVTLIIKKENKLTNSLSLILMHNKYSKSYQFDTKTEIIRIGRNPKCEVSYNIEGMSKVQCWYFILLISNI